MAKKKTKNRKPGKPKKAKQAPKRTPDYIIYTDGGCANNPGGQGGYGAVVQDVATGELALLSEGFKSTTNNRMEIMAAIAALAKVPRGATVDLYSDSQYLINCFSGIWNVQKNTDLFERLDAVSRGKAIVMHWVPGHTGNALNELADRLATEAMFGPDRKEDTGYHGEQSGRPKRTTNTKRKDGGAMAIPISAPAGLREDMRGKSANELVSTNYISRNCAQTLVRFWKSNRRFSDYVSLKTGGMDMWSRMKPGAIVEKLKDTRPSEKAAKFIRKCLQNERKSAAAMRWYARGLSAEDSVRKVLVDAEVAANCSIR